MPIQTNRINFSKIEKVPDKTMTKLIDKNSFVYRDASGKRHVQDVKAFNAENESYYNRKITRSREELRHSFTYLRSKTRSFYFFQLPKVVIWDEFQTGIRNQGSRNTCSGFAMVAAIEARYKRDYGLDLDLSEQFFWHCYKSTSLKHPKEYKYENQSSYWGGGNSGGVRKAVNFSIPLEEDCPYLNGHQMTSLRNLIPGTGSLSWKSDPADNQVTQDEVDAFEYSPLYISHQARQNAKYGARSYTLYEPNTIKNNSSLEKLIAFGNEVIVDANLKWKVNPSTGVREYDSTKGNAWHTMLVVGYDRDKKVFYIKNSHGESGLIRVTYEFASECFTYGSIITEVRNPNAPVKKERALGSWHMNHDGWKGKLVIRRYTNEHNEVTRLGHYFDSKGKAKAVNGKYVNANQGIVFYITDSDDTAPTIESGQKFRIDVFSWDITQGAGNTVWNSTHFGAYINRTLIQSRYGRNYIPSKWEGSWQMNHDGWKGTLTVLQLIHISSFGWLVKGQYKPVNGSSIAFFGNIRNSAKHTLNFSIRFSSDNLQQFVLHFHGWSADLASGYTMHKGKRYGAVAFKS